MRFLLRIVLLRLAAELGQSLVGLAEPIRFVVEPEHADVRRDLAALSVVVELAVGDATAEREWE